jgi:hypothetical protein
LVSLILITLEFDILFTVFLLFNELLDEIFFDEELVMDVILDKLFVLFPDLVEFIV